MAREQCPSCGKMVVLPDPETTVDDQLFMRCPHCEGGIHAELIMYWAVSDFVTFSHEPLDKAEKG